MRLLSSLKTIILFYMDVDDSESYVPSLYKVAPWWLDTIHLDYSATDLSLTSYFSYHAYATRRKLRGRLYVCHRVKHR